MQRHAGPPADLTPVPQFPWKAYNSTRAPGDVHLIQPRDPNPGTRVALSRWWSCAARQLRIRAHADRRTIPVAAVPGTSGKYGGARQMAAPSS